MKLRMKIRVADGIDLQAVLVRLGEHFENKWETRTNDLTEGELFMTSPRRAWVNRHYAPRRLGLARPAFEYMRIVAVANELLVEVKVSNLLLIIAVILYALFCVHAGGFRWGTLVLFALSLPFAMFIPYMATTCVVSTLRKQIKGVIADGWPGQVGDD